MDGDVVDKIKELAVNSFVFTDDNGNKFSPLRLAPIRNIDRIDRLTISTLCSLKDFINENPQGLDLDKAILVINGDFTIDLWSAPSEQDMKRTLYLHVEWPISPFGFNRFMDSTTFLIALQTLFVDSPEAQQLFMDVSSLQIEDGVKLTDDGKSTTVTTKQGVSAATIANVSIRSIQMLRPYRFFPEVEQVESPFLLRLSGSKETGAMIALFECDGGAWKTKAAEAIKGKLEEIGLKLPIYA